MTDPLPVYDPQAEYRVRASSALDRADRILSKLNGEFPWPEARQEAEAHIRWAAVAIAIADHYQREEKLL